MIVAILLASIISMGIGMLWYGPLFGQTWIKAMGWNPKVMAKEMKKAKAKGMGKTYVAAFVSNVVMFAILAKLIYAFTITSPLAGAGLGILIWFGFVATSSLSPVLWEGKTVTAYAVYNGYAAVTLAIAGALLAAW